MSTQVKILLLAFWTALYPTLLAAVIVLLAQPRPKRMLGAFLIGGLTMSITAGFVIVVSLGGEVNSTSSARSYSTSFAVAGLLLLIAVVLASRADVRWRERRQARKGPRPPKEKDADKPSWTQRVLAGGSVPLAIVGGVLVNVPGAGYLVALKEIAAANLSDVHSLVVIVEFNLIMFLFAEIPLVGLIVAPERTGALVARFNRWLSDHSRQIAVVVCLGLAAVMLVSGLAEI